MFSIDRKKPPCENMKNFNSLPEFDKELKRLGEKYPSLSDDLKKFEKLIAEYPTGIGVNFTRIHHSPHLQIVKARLSCKSLRDRSIRVIYAYHKETITFMYLEIYFKGEKENENYERVKEYIKTHMKF